MIAWTWQDVISVTNKTTAQPAVGSAWNVKPGTNSQVIPIQQPPGILAYVVYAGGHFRQYGVGITGILTGIATYLMKNEWGNSYCDTTKYTCTIQPVVYNMLTTQYAKQGDTTQHHLYYYYVTILQTAK